MKETTAKKQYQDFLMNEELLEIFPHFSGNWEEDKEEFEIMFEQNKS
jgi:hypothetical protein